VEPVRIKMYGLVWRTRRGYLTYSVFEALCLVAFWSFWFLGWPRWKQTLRPLREQPAFGRFYIQLMDAVPWILLAAAAYKLIELWVVLRRFALKEAAARDAATSTPKVSAGSG